MRFLVPILLVHFLICVLLGAALSISSDESCSLATTEGSVTRTVIQSIAFEWQPPGYFVLLWIWRQANESILWARLLSVGFTLASTIAFWRLANQLARQGSQWPIWASAFLAIHPFTISAAVDVRLYALGLLLSTLQLDFFIRVYVKGKASLRWWYVVIGVISLYTNILLGLCLAAQHAVIWCFGKKSQIVKHFFAMIVIGMIYLPMFLFQLQWKTDIDTPSEPYSLFEFGNFVVGSISHGILPLPRIPETLLLRKLMAVALCCLLAVFWWYGRSDRNQQDHDGYRINLVYLVLVSIFLLCFLFCANLIPSPRYSYPLLAVSVIVWGLLLESAISTRKQQVMWISLLAIALTSNVMSFHSFSKPGDVVRISAFLKEEAKVGQPILCFPSEMETMLSRYDHGSGRLVPVVEKQRMDRFLFADFDIPNEKVLQESLDFELSRTEEFWLILLDDAINMSSCHHNCHFLDSYLESRFDEMERFPFSGATAKRFRRKKEHGLQP